MLEMRHITKVFNPGTVNEKIALNDFSLTLEDGDFVTVIGGNGAGKSTMMNAIAGVFPVDKGEITINNVFFAFIFCTSGYSLEITNFEILESFPIKREFSSVRIKADSASNEKLLVL